MTRIAYICSCLPSTHSYIVTSSSQPYENVYILQPFSFLSGLFGSTCSSLERNHRNFIKLRKRQTTNMGEDTCLLAHVALFLYIDTLRKIFSPHTFYSLQHTFNISSLFFIISALVHAYTQRNIQQTVLEYL